MPLRFAKKILTKFLKFTWIRLVKVLCIIDYIYLCCIIDYIYYIDRKYICNELHLDVELIERKCVSLVIALPYIGSR